MISTNAGAGTPTIASPLPRRLVGKMAAVLMLAGTIFYIVAEAAAGHFEQRMLLSGGVSLVVGIALWFVPWDRLGSAGTIGFFVFGISTLVLGDVAASGHTHEASVPVFLITLFAWNGLAHQRWMSLKLSPLVAAVYVSPILFGQRPDSDLFGIVFTVPFAVLVGEAIAWITAKLTTAENERLLIRHRADFLTAAQHELRTPLTTINGYARVLKDRGESLRPEQRNEFAKEIISSVARMQSLLKRLDDLQTSQEELKELGLLAPHYGGDQIDLDDPLRGSTEKGDQ